MSWERCWVLAAATFTAAVLAPNIVLGAGFGVVTLGLVRAAAVRR